MNSCPTIMRKFLPGEVIEIAQAMSVRSAREEILAGTIYSEIASRTFEPEPARVRRAKAAGAASLAGLRIEHPETEITLREMVDAQTGDAGYRYKAKLLQEDVMHGLPVEANDARTMSQTIAHGSELDAAFLTEKFYRKFAAAQEIAQEHNKDVASVYLHDTLNLKAGCKAFEPADYGYEFETRLEATRTHLYAKALLHVYGNALARFMTKLIPGTVSSEDREEIQKMVRTAKKAAPNDPEIRSQYDSFMELNREAIRQQCIYKLANIWGPDAFYQLAPDQQDKLMPAKPLVLTVAKVVGL